MTMADRPNIAPDLQRIRKAAARTKRARLRIMIATDPHRPVHTLSLPRSLPKILAFASGGLLLVTAVLIFVSSHMHGSRAALERRVRAMVEVADAVALNPLRGNDGETMLASTAGAQGGLHAPAGPLAQFTIESANTGETMDVRFNLLTGEIEPGSYRQFRHLMRCLHTQAETPPDPRLVELLYKFSQRTHQKIILVSGFRAPMYSLATLSYHTRGMAADIRIPGMTAMMVRDLAFSMGVKGVGFYPVSQFVHVDVRDDKQYWIDYSSRQKGESETEGAEHGPDKNEAMPPLAAQPIIEAATPPPPPAQPMIEIKADGKAPAKLEAKPEPKAQAKASAQPPPTLADSRLPG